MGNRLILGKTNIGDLLLNNKITETNVENWSADNIKLTIPSYQRPYKWTAKNANQLLDDIEEAMNTSKEVYRVGTLILEHSPENDPDVYNIVDGQQRIITFSLLLKCLKQEEIPFLKQELYANSYNLQNVKNNYRALSRRIEKLFEDEKANELTKFVKNNCEFIVVITNDTSEAFQFFDSQNARGKALYPHDLLKAFHLREMRDMDAVETERLVKIWENTDQKKLAELFSEYLYRLKEWIKGNKSFELSEQNIEIFKGVTSSDKHPYAQFYKGAFAYVDELNKSYVPFVSGIQILNPFQISAPIIAGAPFFEYSKHYYDILSDIQNNEKYEGYFINDDPIVKVLDQHKYKNGIGNRITRKMFDTAILLYVDRFCPMIPAKRDIDYLEQFTAFAFVWAYSMRVQYRNVGWQVAQNYIMGEAKKDVANGFNIYKIINEADSPSALLSRMMDSLVPLETTKIVDKYIQEYKNAKEKNKKAEEENENTEKKTEGSILKIFEEKKFWEGQNDAK